MNHARTQRSERRTASSQPTVGLLYFSGDHSVDHHTAAESARAAAHHGRVPDQQHTNADFRSNLSQSRPCVTESTTSRLVDEVGTSPGSNKIREFQARFVND